MPVATKTINMIERAAWAASETLLFADERSPFRAKVTPADKRLMVIVGENASGKSLFFRVLATLIHDKGPTVVTISIRERSGGGTFEMSRMRQAMMFGEEAEQSTGATSVKVVKAAFEHNLGHDSGSVLALDEPEMGLSDGYATAFGQYIGEQARKVPKACSGVIVVTHSRSLVRGLVDGYGKTPTFVKLGVEGPEQLDAWLDEPEHHTIDELLALPDVGFERWRAVSDLLKTK